MLVYSARYMDCYSAIDTVEFTSAILSLIIPFYAPLFAYYVSLYTHILIDTYYASNFACIMNASP